MNEIFLTVVNMGISASWIVLAVLVLRLLLKKAPKWVNVVLWGIVGIRLVCPFSFESVLSLIPSNETIPTNIIHQSNPSINSGINFVDTTVNGFLSDRYAEGVTVPVDYSKIIITALAIIWLVGIAAMLIYTLISYIKIKSKVKQAVLKDENIWFCDSISTPFIFGVISPKIYLPFNLSEQATELVILHEKSHIKRKDYLWKPLGFLILTLHWFNPLMWLGFVLLCRDIELATDENVIKELDTERKADYSQALLTCSVNRRAIAACPLAFGEVGVKERVKTVLSYKKPAFWLIIVSVIAVIIAAVCLLTSPNAKSLQNIEHSDLSSYQENTDNIMKYNGEVFEAISSFDKELLYDLITIKISNNEISKSRSEDRDRTNTLVLRTKTDSEPTINSYMKGLYICFNKDFTEVWVNDGVKPSLSYKVLNPQKAQKIYNDLCSGTDVDNNENNAEPLGDGVIQFYNEPTAEYKIAIVDKWATMTNEDFALFLQRIEGQKWVDDTIVDRLAFYFDCRISYGDFIYISFEQKVVYYKERFTELTDENASLIKSYYTDDEIDNTENNTVKITNRENGETKILAENKFADFIKSNEWKDGLDKCAEDYTVEINGSVYYYSTSCGTFNDKTNNKNLNLDEKTKNEVNAIFKETFATEGTSVFEQIQKGISNMGINPAISTPLKSENDVFDVRRTVIDINDKGAITHYGFENATVAKKYSTFIDKTGSQISVYGEDGLAKSSIYEWTDKPHWYLKDNSIILYVGTDEEIITLLTDICGKQFAGQ